MNGSNAPGVVMKMVKGGMLTCHCGRKSCGLLSDPPKIDEQDADNLFLPNAYGNAIIDCDFQQWRKTTNAEQQKASVEAEYKTRLAAASAYVKDMLAGKPPKGVQLLEGIA